MREPAANTAVLSGILREVQAGMANPPNSGTPRFVGIYWLATTFCRMTSHVNPSRGGRFKPVGGGSKTVGRDRGRLAISLAVGTPRFLSAGEPTA
jgi:hypothetical protein